MPATTAPDYRLAIPSAALAANYILGTIESGTKIRKTIKTIDCIMPAATAPHYRIRVLSAALAAGPRHEFCRTWLTTS